MDAGMIHHIDKLPVWAGRVAGVSHPLLVVFTAERFDPSVVGTIKIRIINVDDLAARDILRLSKFPTHRRDQ
jgi:hypothetical protein